MPTDTLAALIPLVCSLLFHCVLAVVLVKLAEALGFVRLERMRWTIVRVWLPVNLLFVGACPLTAASLSSRHDRYCSCCSGGGGALWRPAIHVCICANDMCVCAQMQA